MWRHLPNLLTLLRLLAAVPVAWLILDGALLPALLIFVAAALTDGVDGWLARRFQWQSRLGGWLDPLADKMMLIAAAAALAVEGILPLWLLVLLVLRDVLIVSGATFWHWRFAPLDAEPSLLGKLTTFALMLLLALMLATRAGLVETGPAWMQAFAVGAAMLLVLSGADYVWRWSGKARRMRRSDP